jgi:hypothetical protein
MFHCINLRKKKCTVDYDQGSKVFKLNDEELEAKEVFFVKASDTEEFAYLLVNLETPYEKKPMLLLRSTSWLLNEEDDDDDQLLINQLNDKIQTAIGDNACVLDTHVESRLHGTAVMSKLFPTKNALVSPESTYKLDAEDIDVIFCERVTSYLKTFDMSLVLKGGKVVTHECISRKHIPMFAEFAENNKLEFYQTGPDRLPWKLLLEQHQEHSWSEINDMLNAVGEEVDDDSEWEQDHTEDDEDSELDDCTTEDESDYEDEPSPKRVKN